MLTIDLESDVKVEINMVPSVISHFSKRYNINKSSEKVSSKEL